MNKISPLWFRTIIAALFTAVVAGSWDAWWHGFLGRESLWSAPHLLLYSAVIIAVCTGLGAWYKTKEKIWRRIAMILLLVPLSAPFDEMWHQAFGAEDISSPLIVWSPPHIALILAIALSLIVLMPQLRRDTDVTARHFFGLLAGAAILNLLLFLTTPLEPTGPYALLGFWSVGIATCIIATILMIFQRLLQSSGSAVSLTMFFLVLAAITFAGPKMNIEINIAPHDHPPNWLFILSFLAPAAMADILRKQSPLWIGLTIGALHAGVLYGLSPLFFEAQFLYSMNEVYIGLLSGMTGGVLAGVLVQQLQNRKILLTSSLAA